MNILVQIQGWMHGLLASRMVEFSISRDWTVLAAILPLGIAFGAIHAVTPGHGKSVLAAYLVGSRLPVLRSLAVAGVQALTHVGMAVLIALVALPLMSRTLGSVGRAPSIEVLSRGLLVAIGLWLAFSARQGHGHDHAEGEGIMVGVTAGLVPCPLTLFAMVMALGRGMPEAGIAFAAAMMIGVGLTLSGVALLATQTRVWVVGFMARHSRSVAQLSRVLDGTSAALLVTIGVHGLLT